MFLCSFQKADLAVADLTITYEREQGVDFTMPFMNLGVTILFKKPTAKDPNLFSFLSPLSLGVWIYIVTAYLAVSMLLYMLARYAYDYDCRARIDPALAHHLFVWLFCPLTAVASLAILPSHCCRLIGYSVLLLL